MNAKHIIRSIGLVFLLLCTIVPIAAFAQEITVLDGAMALSYKSARMDGAVNPVTTTPEFPWHPKISRDHAADFMKRLHFPVISPDGNSVVLCEPGVPGTPGHFKLHSDGYLRKIGDDPSQDSRIFVWNVDKHFLMLARYSDPQSRYISWDDDGHIAVRDGNQPFARDAVPRNSLGMRVYDDNDTIRLETPNGIVTVSADGERAYAPFLSPDSRYVVYNALGRGLVLYDIAKRAPVLIAKHATWPAFSPDGGYLVYVETADNGHALTRGDLIVLNLRSRTAHRIANPNHEIRINATLSRDGRRIAYETEEGQVWVADVILD